MCFVSHDGQSDVFGVGFFFHLCFSLALATARVCGIPKTLGVVVAIGYILPGGCIQVTCKLIGEWAANWLANLAVAFDQEPFMVSFYQTFYPIIITLKRQFGSYQPMGDKWWWLGFAFHPFASRGGVSFSPIICCGWWENVWPPWPCLLCGDVFLCVAREVSSHDIAGGR